MKDFGVKPWLLPQPVLIIGTYDPVTGQPDAMNAAWGGQYDANLIELCLSPHKTTANILEKKAFTVAFGTVEQVVACDYVGLVSANNVPDKLEKAGWSTHPAKFVDAPIIEQLPLALECRLKGLSENGNIIGEIVNVAADESILNEQGEIDLSKLHLISYDPIDHNYLEIGKAVGKAFSDGKKLM